MNPQPHRIDTHHHIVPPKYLARAREQVLGVAHVHAPKLINWTPAMALDAMDQGGVATAVTSISSPGVWFGDDAAGREIARDCNEFAARMAQDHKGRFGVFAALPLPDVEGSLSEIEYALDTLGADGFCLMTNYDDKWPGDAAFAPVFDELNRRRALVFFHPTAAACCTGLIPGVPEATIEFPFDTVRAVVSLLYSGTFSRCAGIKFIFPHAGSAVPLLKARICRLAGNDRVLAARLPQGPMHELQKLYYDIALSARPETLAPLLHLVTVEKLLFGSDFPFANKGATMEDTLEGMYGHGFTAAELRALERGNAEVLLPRFR